MINKQNKLRRILTISLALAILVGATSLVFYLRIQVNLAQAVLYPLNSSYQDTGDYEINSETILDALDQGKTNVFMSILTTPGIASTPNKSWTKGLYNWGQSDYLKVANALLQFAWNDNLEGWHLYSIYFVRGCQDNPAGFDSGNHGCKELE